MTNWSDELTIYHNAEVVTMAPARPRAEAVATRGDRIVALGASVELLDAAPRNTRLIDLGGRAVTPGFIESHAHIYWYGLTLSQVDVQPWSAPTIADVLDRIRDAAKETPPGEWIEGYGFDPNLVAEGRNLTRHDLDSAAPNHPVYITVGHAAWVNTRALEIAGVDAATADPPGGRFGRDGAGLPDGVISELSAIAYVARHLPQPNFEASCDALRAAAKEYSHKGITTVHDPLAGGFPLHFEVMQKVTKEADFPVRIVAFPAERIATGMRLTTGFGDGRLRLGPVKLFADGSIQYYTGALTEPYHTQAAGGSHGELDDFRTIDAEDLAGRVQAFHRRGFQVAIHANGDAAIDAALDAIDRALQAEPRDDHRHRLEHCQAIRDDQLERMAGLGVNASFFVNHVRYYGDIHHDVTLGPERGSRISPLASAKKAGVRFGLHSDSPVTDVSPLASIAGAMERRTPSGRVLGPKQRISAQDGLSAYTTDPAFMAFSEAQTGSIEPGKLADLTILSADPTASGTGAELERITVEGVIRNGQSLWRVAGN